MAAVDGVVVDGVVVAGEVDNDVVVAQAVNANVNVMATITTTG